MEMLQPIIDVLPLCIVIIAFFAILYVIMAITGAILSKKHDTPPEEKDIDLPEGQNEANETPYNNDYPYVKPYLLTKNEWGFYRALKPITDKYKLHILSKVRMADIVSVKKGTKNFQTAFAKIKSKHVDFVLANPNNLATYCVIELDDKSHEEIAQQQNDHFKNEVFKRIGMPIIRTTSISGMEDKICAALCINKKP